MASRFGKRNVKDTSVAPELHPSHTKQPGPTGYRTAASPIASALPVPNKQDNDIIVLRPYSITPPRKNMYIFFHICCINNYKEVTAEIITQFFKSGLQAKCTKIFYSVTGELDREFITHLNKIKKFELVYLNSDIGEVEYPMLEYLQSFCEKTDCYALYVHTKGVSLPKDEFRQNWRRRLLQKVISEYSTCIALLNQGCNIAGCGWKEKEKEGAKITYYAAKYSHYSGNFWWANSDYIKKLPSIRQIKEEHIQFKNKYFLKYRTQAEFWIGMSTKIRVGVNGEYNKEYSHTNFYIPSNSDVPTEPIDKTNNIH